MRDLNAKLGKEDMYRDMVGKHSLHQECNDNGQKLVNFVSVKLDYKLDMVSTQENP